MKFIHEYILVNDDQVNIKDCQQLTIHSHVLIPNIGFQLCCFLFLTLEKNIVLQCKRYNRMGEKKLERERKEEKERHIEKKKGRLEKNRGTEERKENADIYNDCL